MIDPTSPRFWAVVAAVFLLTRVLPLPRRHHPWVFLLALASLPFVFPVETPTVVGLLAIAAYGWLALRSARSPLAVVAHVAVLSAAFVVSVHSRRLLSGLPGLDSVVPLIGLPYVYLRQLHLLFDVNGGRLSPPSFPRYLVYLVPFHQLVAGPIERFQSFERTFAAPLGPLGFDETVAALDRVASGLVKKLVLAELVRSVGGFRFEREGLGLWLELDLQALWVYLDFSGYMDLVIGAGMLMGWTPPENFRWPYLSRNIVEFWTRWHMTLGDWVRDYLFLPLNLRLQRSVPAAPLVLGLVCYLAAMVFVGFWHRPSLQFVLWGLVHGVGILACKLYEEGLKRVLGRQGYRRYRASRIVAVLSCFVTFQFVAVSFLFALSPLGEALAILGSLL